ncbi:MAG: hypothetical protein IH969_07690, partial [Candidatus Krumholzibacteriota bacterium]|nr:hypothetical protein [Candidatus Krumholzibacteriota bacterium]
MPVVLITPEAMLHKPAPYVDMLRDAGFEIQYPRNTAFTRGLHSDADAIEELGVCDAVIAGGERITRGVLAALPRLRVVARSGVGFDRVDIPAATERNVAVTITPTANHECVAEHALFLLFAVAKSGIVNDRSARSGDWQTPLTEPVRGRTVGILGLGRIGRSFAIRAAALGMTVIAHELSPDEEFVRTNRVELVDFETLLERSDYVS